MRAFDPSRIPFPRGYEDFQPPQGASSYVLEIGAGAGLHALAWARAHPESVIFAVEHSRSRFARLAARAAEASLGNLVPIHADAESFVVHLLGEIRLARVMILYPNPYPKHSQANKRWHEMPFMKELLARMHSNAVLELATNLDFYAKDFEERMLETWNLRRLSRRRVTSVEDPTFVARTHFEKKYYERGESLHLLEFGGLSALGVS